ncbi:MAG: hypothetical protein IK134_00505 [Oscillospiraceae bacterium]|nr:hypothetical protein [Oscillospiraceae bacterium]
MKCVMIRIGTSCPYGRKYMDGRLELRVLALEGDPETVDAAEALRYARLDRSAVELQEFYTSTYSLRQLDELFAAERVLNLKELLRKTVTDRNFYLMSLLSTERILEADRAGLFDQPYY